MVRLAENRSLTVAARKRAYRVLLLCLLATVAAFPQESGRWPVESIRIEGLVSYPESQLVAVTGLKAGQVAGKAEFEAARDRLVATGLFETVGYRFFPAPGGKGYAASFQVVEVMPIPVRFEDLGVADADLTAFLRARDPLFGARIPATKAVIERYTRLIEECLASGGKREKVAGVAAPLGNEKFELVFRPARNPPAVAVVDFEGNTVMPAQALREAVSGVAVGALYTEPRFREILDTSVRPLYEARGRVRVGFPRVRTEPARDVEGLRVIVTVEEGESYDLGTVEVVSRTVLPPGDILKAGDFKTGDLANFDLVRQGLDRILDLLHHQGYLRANVTTERRIDDAKKVVHLAVRVDEGPQFHMGKLDVKGLDLNAEAEIRRLWNLKEGRPFNSSYPDYFLDQIRERGVFETLGRNRAETKLDEAAHTVDVTLHFGAPPPPPPEKKRHDMGPQV
jgi:outer membrane protein insertion porin family